MKILLAEDSRTSQQLATFLLEDEGHSVEVASNGLEAVEVSAITPFDLILMDVQMPELDGLQATAQIRRREESAGTRTLIIAMTAQEEPGDREACLRAGMDDYVSKPLNIVELSAALDRNQSETARNVTTSTPGDPEAPADDSGESLIDWDAALAAVSGHQAILDSIIEAALEEMPELLSQLHQSIEASDAAVIHRSAHTIKGAMRSFQPVRLIDIASQIESLAASSSAQRLLPLYKELEEQVDSVLAELRQSRAISTSSPINARDDND